jgi:hypothetical protein
MDNLPQKKKFFWAYFIRFGNRNNFVEEFFSIRGKYWFRDGKNEKKLSRIYTF